MGSASAEMQMQSNTGILHLAATVALLEGRPASGLGSLGPLPPAASPVQPRTPRLRPRPRRRHRAPPRAETSAWKEVARRVAHEIKNPLTPISLNAELIQRHIGRLSALLAERSIESPSPAIIQRSTEVISISVETMRSLVDQFSALAEFPSRPPPPRRPQHHRRKLARPLRRPPRQHPRPSNLAPTSPSSSPTPKPSSAPSPTSSTTPPRPCRTASSANSTSPPRLLPSGMVELTVADTGPGLTDEMRERLFLPYFSTKQRGTGLGLSIAAKISRSTTAPSAPKKTSPPAPASSSNSAPPPTPSTPHPPTADATLTPKKS